MTEAEDHDLGVKEKLTPFGFFLPEYDDLFLFFTLGYVNTFAIKQPFPPCESALAWGFPQSAA